MPDLVGVWWAERVARALAPLRCSGRTPGRGSGSGAVPDAVGLDEVLEPAGAAPQALNEGWADAVARGGGLAAPAAVVGRGPHGIHAIDLSRDGPHVLVGGTTGSGKSEFLRTLIVSLSLSSPPSDLTLVLVDFKGGAAFGPCADLPHVVGLVTDLDDHLAARALTSLRAELRRRERMLADAGAPDLEAYARSPRANAEPMPRLVVVIDELRTLVDEVPEFVSGLVRLAAQGRSLGIHLVLATQRPAGAITAEVQANVSLRIAFRVRDRTDSVTVVEDGAAADLPATAPGRAVARGADGRLLTFQSAILGPARPHARARFLEVTRVRTVADAAAGPATQPTAPKFDHRSAGRDWRDGGAATVAAPALQRLRVDATREIVRRVIEAHRLTGAAAPRRPWLPPLSTHLTPATLANVPTLGVPDPPGGAVPTTASTAVAADGGVPVGLVDEPDAQRVSALRWHPEGGTWLLSGAPRSGRTRAVRGLVLQAVSAADPRALHVHLVDPTGTLVDLVGLPHVGTRADGNDVRALTSLVDHLRSEVDRRRALHGVGRPPQGPEPTVLVVIDGWEQVAERLPDSAWGSPLDDLLRVLRDGASVGIVGAVAGGRGLLQPRWAGIGGSTFLLGRLDPLDLALAGLRAAEAPKNPAVGRGIRLADRREVQFASADDVLLAGVVRRAGPRPADGAARRYHPLPQRILLPSPEGSVAHPVVGHVLGISAGDHEVVAWEPERQGRVLLVSGPPRSGRTNVLRVLAASITADGRRLAMVSRVPLGPSAGHGAPIWVVHPEDVDPLVDARRRDPALAVLVDDADLLDEAPIGPPLKQILELVDRDGGLFVAVASATGLGSRFRGIDVLVARRRTGLLLAPSPADGDLLGAPATHGIPALPGRGLLVSGGTPTELQVYLAPESGVGPAPADGAVGAVGLDARDAVVGGRYEQRGRGRGDRDAEDAPSDEGLVAPDQPDPHRDQERAPHDRRGPGPRGVAEPPPGQGREADAPHEDEQRRHDDPRRVAPLTDGELVDVEHGEAHEDGGLQTGQRGGEPAGAA
ncbi:MAG TPA: FtsK/SpoIIIE domain-containing protein [Ornithinibacter sp.]|nr:FtsK/SpoIIIE domain-containing protein [Ornithinibacter sp.]